MKNSMPFSHIFWSALASDSVREKSTLSYPLSEYILVGAQAFAFLSLGVLVRSFRGSSTFPPLIGGFPRRLFSRLVSLPPLPSLFVLSSPRVLSA